MSIPVNTNLYSTITIFKHSILTTDKNFCLDKNGSNSAIEEYLSTLSSETFTNCQYVKQGLAIVIKLNKSQEVLNLIDSNDWNYCKIQNDKSNPCYYFVIKKEWLSKETIAISLVMDTLNNFAFNKDYVVNKKTTIKRQHKDRIKYLGSDLGERIGTTSRFLIPVVQTIPRVYTYPVGAVFSGSFTPEAGILTYDIKIGFAYADPSVPEPSVWNELPPELEPFFNVNTGSFGVRVISPYTVTASEQYDRRYFQLTIRPKYEAFCRNVDLISEGINVPVYKRELGQVDDNTNPLTWYLLYRNRDNPNPDEQFNDSPVECYLIPENPVRALNNSSSKLITTSNTSSGKYYMFESFQDDGKGANIAFEIDGVVYQPSEKYRKETFWEYATIERNILIIHNNGGTSLSFNFVKLSGVFNSNGTIRSQKRQTMATGSAYASIKVISSYNSVLPWVDSSNPITGYDINEYYIPDEQNRIDFGTPSYVYLKDINSLDRTDSRNIKLIALPYCPAQTSYNSNYGLNLLNNFQYDSASGWYKSLDITTSFKNTFTTSLIKSPFSALLLKNLDLNEENSRNDYLESKLYHSDFYRPKFVYDSFNYTYCLERYDYSEYLHDHPSFPELEYKVTFVMTRTINSKFLFQLDTQYLTHSMDDYDGIVAVSRNNEEVLYNSAYINYVRSGFNYDKKTLARRQENAGWTIGLSIGSAILGIIGSVATQNPLPAVLGIAGAGVGITSQIVSNIQTQAQGEQTIQQKLEEANRQAVAVSGSDDVDLLTAYSNNKAKLVLYDISERMKKLVGDLFYYCGYKLDLQAVPDKDSRYWFNFVQCDLVVNYDSNVPSDMMNDLIERFKQGVTFFHYHNGFDLTQEKENLEISLINR